MKWVTAWWNTPPTRRSKPKPRFGRLTLEKLDDRVLPAVLTWTAAADSTWQTDSSWTDLMGMHAVPGVFDEVHFDNHSSAKCTLTADAACMRLYTDSLFTGTIDLGLRTLTVNADSRIGGGTAGALNGGNINDGILTLAGGILYQSGAILGTTYIDIAPASTSGWATYSISSGSINATSGTALDTTVRSGGEFDVAGNVTIGNNLKILSGGVGNFTPCITTNAFIENGAVITVSSGGLLELEGASLMPASDSTYISNSGTVQKTNTTWDTIVYFGIRNEASTAVLSAQAGSVEFRNGSPGQVSSSIYQVDGATKIYNGATLKVSRAYTQEAGKFSAMGVASGTSTSTFRAENLAQSININGGSVVLGDGTTNHRTTLDARGCYFKFGATSSLKFGINVGALDNDVLKVNQVSINPMATAVLDTTDLANVPSQNWVFLDGNKPTDESIVGAFLKDVGTTGYTMSRDPKNNLYRLNT